jgi:hypothetical protein
MPEVVTSTTTTTTTQATATPEPGAFDAAALARLNALSRPRRFEPRTFVKSVTPVEIASLVLLVMLVAGVFVIYSFWILPDQVRYVQLSNEVADNQAKIDKLQQQVIDPTSIASEFQEVRDSLDAFRGATLRPHDEGRLQILNAIERVTRETGVQLAGTVEFRASAAEVVTGKEKHKKADKADHTVKSFPSMQVQMSISGSYAQLRSFISRFEGGGQFVIIDSVGLSSAEEAGGKLAGGRAGAGFGGPSGGPITLTIAMTAYFQPEAQGY